MHSSAAIISVLGASRSDPPALHSKLVQPYCYLGQPARQRHRAARQLQNIRLEMKTGLLPLHVADELPRKPPSGSLSSSFVFLMEHSRALNNQTSKADRSSTGRAV